MMKKTFKRLLGLTLSAAMVIGMTACGNEPVKETETQVVSKETTAVKESETQQAEEGVTYPLDTDITLTLWSHRLDLSDDYKDYSESPYHSGLIKRTGVNIEFSEPMEGQKDKDAYNLLLTEDELPYIILRSTNRNELAELYNDGLIYDLTPYLEEYAPDYWDYLTAPENEAVYRQATTADGKVLGFWLLKESTWSLPYMGPIIRQDWLDECGLDTPVTLEDWEQVLITFKEKYNASFGFESAVLAECLMASGTGAMGTGYGYYKDDNGEIQLACLQPEWKEYMEVMNRWYENGLIDNDVVTMDQASLRTKVANNQIGAAYVPMSRMSNFINDAEANGTGAKWVGVSYPRVAEGEPTSHVRWGTVVSPTGAFITTSCPEEYLITAIKFLNYGYTEEGTLYSNLGEEGLSYTLDKEGNPQFTDLVLNDPKGVGAALYKYTAVEGTACFQMDHMTRMRNREEVFKACDLWGDNTETDKHYFSSSLVVFNDEEQLVYQEKESALKTYINEMTQKFLIGTESLENIEAFYAQIDAMGIQDCLEILRTAYARELAK